MLFRSCVYTCCFTVCAMCVCVCVCVCICVARVCLNRRAFVHICDDGPVVFFDDDIAYVTNAAACKYGICCVAFGLWLVLVVCCSVVVVGCCCWLILAAIVATVAGVVEEATIARVCACVCIRVVSLCVPCVCVCVCVHMRCSCLFESACVCAYLRRWTRGVLRRRQIGRAHV